MSTDIVERLRTFQDWDGGPPQPTKPSDEDVISEILRLRSLLKEAGEALEWYVCNDEVGPDGDGFYSKGHAQALAALAKAKGDE